MIQKFHRHAKQARFKPSRSTEKGEEAQHYWMGNILVTTTYTPILGNDRLIATKNTILCWRILSSIKEYYTIEFNYYWPITPGHIKEFNCNGLTLQSWRMILQYWKDSNGQMGEIYLT